MTALLMQWLVVTVLLALLASFAVAPLLLVLEARDAWRGHRLQRRAEQPPLRSRCACDAWVLVWDDTPVYDGAWLHEPDRCYPDWEAVR